MRFSIVGVSCSGKSTLAKNLAEHLGIEFIEQDKYFWQPNWQQTPREEFEGLITDKIQGESWTICGNHSPMKDPILERATHVIWLNYSPFVIASRAFRRTARRVFLNEPCCNGNRETFLHAYFSKNSILWWVLKTYKQRKEQYSKLQKNADQHGVAFLEFKTPSETEAWLKSPPNS